MKQTFLSTTSIEMDNTEVKSRSVDRHRQVECKVCLRKMRSDHLKRHMRIHLRFDKTKNILNAYQELQSLQTQTINHTLDDTKVVVKEKSTNTYDKYDLDLYEIDIEEAHTKLEKIYNREKDRVEAVKMYKLEEEELMQTRCKEMSEYLDKQIEIYIKLLPINTQEKLDLAYRHLNAQVAKYTGEDE